MGFAQTPYLTNINIQQQSADKIIITYDLAGKSKDSYAVKVVRIEIINSPKGIVPQSITGDIGNNISAGKNKTIFAFTRRTDRDRRVPPMITNSCSSDSQIQLAPTSLFTAPFRLLE